MLGRYRKGAPATSSVASSIATAPTREHGARTRDALVDRVEAHPTGAPVLLAWASWESVRELRGARTIAAVALLMSLVVAATALRPMRYVFVDQASGERIPASDLSHGRRLRGNRPADLDTALREGMELVQLRFGHYDYAGLNPALRALYARSTPHGRQVLAKTVPRKALSMLIVADSGVARIRVFGEGPTITGLAPGRAKMTVPLSARYYSRHVPFTGVKSGIPLGAIVELTLAKVGAHWMLDDITGELLDPALPDLWEQYGTASAPLPSVVIRNSVVPPDSALAAGYKRGVTYANQFTH